MRCDGLKIDKFARNSEQILLIPSCIRIVNDWTINELNQLCGENAVVVELVDTHGSGSCILTDVGVRVSPITPQDSTEVHFYTIPCKHPPSLIY